MKDSKEKVFFEVSLFSDSLVMSFFRKFYVLFYLVISVMFMIQKGATFEECERNYTKVQKNFLDSFQKVGIMKYYQRLNKNVPFLFQFCSILNKYTERFFKLGEASINFYLQSEYMYMVNSIKIQLIFCTNMFRLLLYKYN